MIYLRAKKNASFLFVFDILDTRTGERVSGAAGLDSEYSLDGGAFADCANEASEIGTSGIYTLTLTAAERNGTTTVKISSTTEDARIDTVCIMPDELDEANAELAAIPGATGTMREMLQYIFQLRAHRLTQTFTEQSIFKADGTTALGVRSISHDGETTDVGAMETA